MNTTRTRTASRLIWMIAVVCLSRAGDIQALPVVNGLGQVSQPIVQTYLVPMPAQSFYRFFDSVNSSIGTSQVHTVQSIVVHQPGTVIVYDHWEDGYEADPGNPTQATTMIWGDGNSAHGIPPGHTNNVLNVGDVLVMEEDQNLPRSAPPSTNAVFARDGGDRISSTRVISMQFGGWPLPDANSNQPDPGYMFASMVELYPTNRWGYDFVIPLGGNVQAPASNPSFNFSTLMVQAGENATTVQIDTNGDGTVDVTTNLSVGQTCYLPNDGVRAGATVHATKPVQVDLLTGRLDANYEARGFTIQPTNRIGHSYYTPVATGTATGPNSDGGAHPTTVYLFNPGTSTMTVKVDTTSAGSTNITLTAKSTVGYTLADGNAAHFSSTGAPFVALSVSDTGSSSTAFEWGYTLLDESLLTADVRAGWAPGSVGGSGAPNASPVWITAVSNTTLYVDLDGNSATGALMDPNGNHYDFATNVLALQPLKLYDSSDLDQTGMHVYDLNGVKLAGAWGENGSIAHPQLNVDLGYALAPLNDTSIGNSIWLDLNGNGLQDANEPGLANVKITLTGPGGTVVTYTDSNGNYLFSDLQPGTYTVTVDTSTLPAGLVQSYDPDGTLNNTTVHALGAGESWQGCDFGYKGNAAIGDTVWEDTNANGAQDPGEAGFSNIVVMVTYAGTDGIFGTADDVVARQTTDANGHYFATKLPAGLYRVELDFATIPTGYAFTTAPQLTHTLSGGETWLEADFGLRYPHTKFLYLSDGEQSGVQGMDRIDPVYTHDATTAASMEIGRRDASQALIADDQFLANSFANSDGTQAWAADWNESDAGGTGGASDGNIKVASGSLQITTKNTSDWVQRAIDLSGADAATVTVVIASSTLTSGNPVSLQASRNGGGSWTTLATYNSTATGTFSYNLATALGTPLTSTTVIRFVSGGTGSKLLKIDEVRVDDRVAAVVGPASMVFTQSAPMASTYIVPPNGLAQVTAYLVAPYGNIPLTNAAIAASLSYGSTTFATLTNPAVYRLAPPVVFSVADNFESNGYSGNTGTANWSGDWTEIGESDGAAAGNERVMSDGGSLVLRIMHSGDGVLRAANLTGAGYATLTQVSRVLNGFGQNRFDFSRKSLIYRVGFGL